MVLKRATSSHTNLAIKLPCCKVKKRMVKGQKKSKAFSKFYPWGYLLVQLNLHRKQGIKLAFIPFDISYIYLRHRLKPNATQHDPCP